MRRATLLFLLLFITLHSSFAQAETGKSTIPKWNIGALPVISFNTDLGFQYGVLANVYNYGDGSYYPRYKHTMYVEASRYTKGSGIYRLFYDSEFFIPNIRFTADASYFPDQALNFFGYNGYDFIYNSSYTDPKSDDYKTRMYYKHKRDVLRLKFDFQGKVGTPNLFWSAGYNLMKYDIGSVPIEKLNKGQNEQEMLPDVNTLYDDFVNWNIISEMEKNGGTHHNFQLGLIYDSRESEACPIRGIWSEVVLFNSINKNYKFGRLELSHRQYLPIYSEDLIFAYRLTLQAHLYGESPFYMFPYMIYSYMSSSSMDGLGGSKTIRGMMGNRTVGKSITYSNFELRYKFFKFQLFKQNFYLAVNPFMDAGMVLSKAAVEQKFIPESVDQSQYFAKNKETLHITYGCGLRMAMNENFIIAADFGRPANTQDGGLGVYLGMSWLF